MRYMSEKYFKMMCGVQMEINYSQRGWDEKIEDDSGNSYNRTMNYLEILSWHIWHSARMH